MVFKNFRIQVIIRVAMLALAMIALVWCLTTEHYLRSIYASITVLVLLIELIWYVDRFNRDVNTFMTSLLQHDFTTRFQTKGISKTFDELYDTLNKISYVFETISAEKEAQFRFLEMLVEHLRVGILSMDQSGKIQLANQAVKDLLQKDVLFSLRSLDSMDREFVKSLEEIRSGETRLVKVRVQQNILHLSIHASEFRLADKDHKLISMQNIANELDAREMEAWQKLIRVLTHEIMNSVSPVISLSETMHSLVLRHQNDTAVQDKLLFNTLDQGLAAIKERGKGLYSFTQSYRKLTGVPQLSLRDANTRDIIDHVVTLMRNELNENGIELKISSPDIPVVADPDLMQHVLINLVRNAIDALSLTKAPQIAIGALRAPDGRARLYVRDNGEGIDEAIGEKIFIPFFTTRKNGSGIGLALAKQILQLHHADIYFTSEKGKGTEFVIIL
jgi:two-component system, NtrC family, nitrogen regulation sensor histidine kinase NtrY